MTNKERFEQGINDQMVRLSAGIEDYEDLKDDIIQSIKTNLMKVDILAFGAHPDDVELGCGGTIALSIAQGKTVAIVDLTQGELGTRGDIQTRKNEAKKASDILKIYNRENLKLQDGFFENNVKNQLILIEKKLGNINQTLFYVIQEKTDILTMAKQIS